MGGDTQVAFSVAKFEFLLLYLKPYFYTWKMIHEKQIDSSGKLTTNCTRRLNSGQIKQVFFRMQGKAIDFLKLKS